MKNSNILSWKRLWKSILWHDKEFASELTFWGMLALQKYLKIENVLRKRKKKSNIEEFIKITSPLHIFYYDKGCTSYTIRVVYFFCCHLMYCIHYSCRCCIIFKAYHRRKKQHYLITKPYKLESKVKSMALLLRQ